MNHSKSLITAYLWNMLGKLITRGLSVISTLILVRVLSPEDFGVMAMATIFIGFFQMLANASVNRYIILLDSPTKEDYDAGWTLAIVLRFFSMVVLFIVAPLIAEYMNTPELLLVLQIICFTNFIGAFKSPGIIKLERDVNFKSLNKIIVTAKLCATAFTIFFAIQLESYFALLIGDSILIVSSLILSYVICDHKPVFNFNFEKKMFHFASFLFVRNFLGYTRSQLDTFIVGKSFGNEALGSFSVARQFSLMPQTELLSPAMQPAFSVLSKLKKDLIVFDSKLYQALFIGYAFLLPSAFGLMYCAENFVAVVLGSKWLSITEYIGLLAFLMIPFFTQPILNIAYDSRQKSKVSMLPDILALTFMFLGIYYFPPISVPAFVDLRITVALGTMVILFLSARVFLALKLRLLLLTLAPSAFCSGGMFAGLSLLNIDTSFQILDLLLEICLGVSIYCTLTIITFLIIIKLSPNSFVARLVPEKVYKRLNMIT